MEKNRFKAYFIVVALIHVGVVVLLIATSVLPNPFKREKDVMMAVDFMVDVTPLQEDAPADIGEPPEREDSPEPPERERPKIERSRTKIRRPVPERETPRLSPEEIRRRLAAGAEAGTRNTPVPDEDARCFSLIHRVLHEAWAQPSAEAAGDATATVAIRMDTSGRILERKLVKRSGNNELDVSVMTALNAVERIGGLSVAFLSRHDEITVSFKVES